MKKKIKAERVMEIVEELCSALHWGDPGFCGACASLRDEIQRLLSEIAYGKKVSGE